VESRLDPMDSEAQRSPGGSGGRAATDNALRPERRRLVFEKSKPLI